MSGSQERIVAIEEKKGIHTVKTHHFLLPDGVPDYEDDTNKNFDFRLNLMTAMGAVPHSPMGRDGKLEASVWEETQFGHCRQEYHRLGERVTGPNGFAAEALNGDGAITSGMLLMENGELDTDNVVQDQAQIAAHVLKQKNLIDAAGRNTLRNAGFKVPYLQ